MFSSTLWEDDVKRIIAPFYKDIFDAIKSGFEIHLNIRTSKEYFSNAYSMPIRTRADLIRMKFLDFFVEKYEKRKSNSGIRIISNDDDLVLLVIEETICLRFNKFDNKLNANFNDTQQSKDFVNGQLDIPNLTPNITGLILGYTHDIAWTKCTGIYVKQPRGLAFEITEQMVHAQIEKEKANTVELSKQSALPEEPIVKPKMEDKKRNYGIS